MGRLVTILVYIVTVVVFVAASVILYRSNPGQPEFVVYLAMILSGATGPVVFMGFFFEVFTRYQFKDAMSDAIAESVMLEGGVLHNFEPATRHKYIESVCKSIVGDSYGETLNKFISESFFSDLSSYRDEYEYKIDFSSTPEKDKLTPPDESTLKQYLITMQDYMFACNTLEYSKVFKDRSVEFGKGVVYFVFDGSALHHQLSEETVFFREHLYLSNTSKGYVQRLSGDDLNEFVKNILKFEISYYSKGDWVPSKFVSENDNYGIRITPDKFLPASHSSYRIRLKYVLPMHRDISTFFVILPDPTKSPKILFTCNEATMRNMSYCSFLRVDKTSNEESIKSRNVNKLAVSVKEWTLPMSGITFTWTRT